MSRPLFQWEEDLKHAGAAEDFFDRVFTLANGPRILLHSCWWPAVDVFEVDGGVTVIAELAGVQEEDLDVTFCDGRLRIAGIRKPPPVEHGRGALQIEIEYGRFERVIPIGMPVDSDNIVARYQRGLLVLQLPRQAKRRPVSVAVHDEGNE